MKYCLAIAFISFLTSKSSAQELKTVSPDTYFYRGDLVKVIPARAGGYGFAIYSKSRLIALESLNPFSLAPSGLRSKTDILKLACWQLDHGGRTPHARVIVNQRFPKELATKLMIAAR
jgi:hypothetical protein